MNIENGISFVQLLISGFGLFFVYKQLKGSKALKKSEFEFQVFIEYTRRYQEIILNFPENINIEKFKFPKEKEKKDKILRYMRAYFDLCSEEYFLKETDNVLKVKHWKNWKKGMEKAFTKTAFKESWKIINKDASYNDDFKNFVENIIKGL